MKDVPQADIDRFWKWMVTPLEDVPTAELVWCRQQGRQNSWQSLQNWKAEIERRDKLAADENLIL